MCRLLVVVGGSYGLVTLRNLVEWGEFEVVALVERRDDSDVGGVRLWYLADPPVPGVARNRPYWPSPAYPASSRQRPCAISLLLAPP
ncbi:hypothetical protein C8F01DRAFT_1187642 [Mycena amicta]|nr:hypothetical protein C8F01DRAFT_1187642 [Mycena amicta]